jgi:hypothetical protein
VRSARSQNSDSIATFSERKISIATDKDIRDLDSRLSGNVATTVVVDRRFARSVRRRNLVDMCREAARNNLI